MVVGNKSRQIHVVVYIDEAKVGSTVQLLNCRAGQYSTNVPIVGTHQLLLCGTQESQDRPHKTGPVQADMKW